MPNCTCCGKLFEVPTNETSDGCCSDYCWEVIYAPGPKEEVRLEYDKVEDLA
jgi:hypothetical protein